MNTSSYVGHEHQICGAEEYRLVGGKGDGMRLLHIRNGAGIDMTLSLDRAADIVRFSYYGVNYGYFAPCGFVSPSYCVAEETDFLKSFTAGFLTTCGLSNVGSPCTDGDERFPLHGNISHVPAESYAVTEDDDKITVRAILRDASLFGRKFRVTRTYTVPLFGDTVTLCDEIENLGDGDEPLLMLYHVNVGYPLLSEDTLLKIPSSKITPRNAHAAEDLEGCLTMEKPQKGYEERCYFHKMDGITRVSVYNPCVSRGLEMTYDTAELPFFTEWKMMGSTDYVLGIEPGNTLPDGRHVMREKGLLEILAPHQKKTHTVCFRMIKE